MRTLATVALLLLAALAGCLGTGDDPLETTDTPTGSPGPAAAWARALPEDPATLARLAQATDVEAGAGLWLEGDLAYVAGQNSGFYILDVSAPAAPTLVARMPDQYSRDVDLLHYEDGRTVAVLAASSQGMVFVDVTNASQPERLATLQEGIGNVHNVAVVPGTHLVYNSRSVDTPGVDIVAASDPANPELVQVFGDVTCHDVTFYPGGERAYCPGVRETQVWDISDPAAPTVVTRIVNPAINIHHWALPTHNGTLLIIGDEFAGSTDAAAGCLATADTPLGGTLSDPVGAVWFYDLTDENTPVPVGYLSAQLPVDNLPPTPCTAHFGALVGDTDHLLVGWRAAGTYLIDFTDPSMPAVDDVLPTDGDVWEARLHNGYVFTGDGGRGMDVLTIGG